MPLYYERRVLKMLYIYVKYMCMYIYDILCQSSRYFNNRLGSDVEYKRTLRFRPQCRLRQTSTRRNYEWNKCECKYKEPAMYGCGILVPFATYDAARPSIIWYYIVYVVKRRLGVGKGVHMHYWYNAVKYIQVWLVVICEWYDRNERAAYTPLSDGKRNAINY